MNEVWSRTALVLVAVVTAVAFLWANTRCSGTPSRYATYISMWTCFGLAGFALFSLAGKVLL